MSRQGYEISWPTANTHFDLEATRTVDGKHELLRVQVKTIRRRTDRGPERIVIDCTDGAGNRYPRGSVDLFAGYDKGERRVYYVTPAQLGDRREMWIDPANVYEIPRKAA